VVNNHAARQVGEDRRPDGPDGRSITFQMAEAIVPRDLLQKILVGAITVVRPLPPARC
jgi:hypothetical protein